MPTKSQEEQKLCQKFDWKAFLKRQLPWIKYFIVAIILAWVGVKLYESWGELSTHKWEFHYRWLLFAGVCQCLGYLPAAYFWRHILCCMGQKAGLLASIRAYYISQLGKYTPGKAMVVIMRADIIRSKTVRASCAAAGVFFETFTFMSAGALISAVVVFFWFRDHPEYFRFLLLNAAMLGLSFIPTIPPLFRFVAQKLGVGKGDPEIQENMKKIRLQTVMYGWFLMIFAWLFFGLSIWGTIQGLGLQVEPITQLPKYIAASAMSVVFGFILMVPGGLGAREWVLIQIFAPMFAISLNAVGGDPHENLLKAEGLAIAVAAAVRAVSIVAELVIAAVCMAIPKK